MTLQALLPDAGPLMLRAPLLRLRALDADEARAQSRLSRVIDPLPLAAKGAQVFVALDAPRAEAEASPWLDLSLDGHPAALQMSWSLARAAAGLPLDDADPADAALLLEDALAPWLDEAEALLGIALRLDGLALGAPGLPVRATLNLQGRGTDRAVLQSRLPMRLSLAAAGALATATAPRLAPRREPRGLALRLAVEVTTLDLDLATLRSLEPGDAVAYEGNARRLILEDALAAPAEAAGPGRTRLTGAFAPLATPSGPAPGGPMPDTPDASAPTPALADADLDAVEVRLSFRAGEALLDVATLRGLAPGAIVETVEEAGAQVDILANGRPIGTGELVEVAGRRAVQIRTIFTGR